MGSIFMDLVSRAAIVTANRNQQRDFDPAEAVANIKASEGRGRPFDPARQIIDTNRPVIFIGGGSAAAFDAVAAKHGGVENIYIVATGSAAKRLNKAAQEEAGYPFLERADAVVFNQVDNKPASDDFYKDIAAAVALHPEADIYLASYNGPGAYDALPDAIRVNALMEGYDYGENALVVGLGSTAPTAALIVKMLEGHRDFEFVGIKGADVQAIPGMDSVSDSLEAFRKAAAGLAELDRYPEFEMPAELQRIAGGNGLLVSAGGRGMAGIPSGQWYQLQELKRLVEWGRPHGMRFTFHGGQSLSSLLLDQGVDITLVHDPRGQIQPGTVLAGVRDNGGPSPDPARHI